MVSTIAPVARLDAVYGHGLVLGFECYIVGVHLSRFPCDTCFRDCVAEGTDIAYFELEQGSARCDALWNDERLEAGGTVCGGSCIMWSNSAGRVQITPRACRPINSDERGKCAAEIYIVVLANGHAYFSMIPVAGQVAFVLDMDYHLGGLVVEDEGGVVFPFPSYLLFWADQQVAALVVCFDVLLRVHFPLRSCCRFKGIKALYGDGVRALPIVIAGQGVAAGICHSVGVSGIVTVHLQGDGIARFPCAIRRSAGSHLASYGCGQLQRLRAVGQRTRLRRHIT